MNEIPDKVKGLSAHAQKYMQENKESVIVLMHIHGVLDKNYLDKKGVMPPNDYYLGIADCFKILENTKLINRPRLLKLYKEIQAQRETRAGKEKEKK